MRVRRTVVGAGAEPPAGFPRWAWWAVFLATFTFAVPLTSPWWSTVFRSEIPGAAEDDGETALPGGADSGPAPVEAPGSMLRVVLHTRVGDLQVMGTLEREIPYVRGVIPQIHAAVSELAVGSPQAPALLPPGTRVLDVAFTPGGTVYIDFSAEIDTGRSAGADEERTMIQGIVNTVTANFTAVRRVILLVDGRSPRPFHLDLTRPLRPDDPMFAVDEPPEPPAAPGATPASAAPGAVPVPPRSSPEARPTNPPVRPGAVPTSR